jgi:SAM-dependent methyltransferase
VTYGYDRLVLRPTGERVIPAVHAEELVYAEHVARYRFAAQFARGRRVLDAGAGEGYGVAMIGAAGAASVVGVDIDDEAVAHAKETYGAEFIQGDITALPFPDKSFDLVVCFETIEHVSDPATALMEFRRVLSDDGLLIISTPNRDEYLVENEFHEREYSPEEFDGLLSDQFRLRTRLYQQNWLLSAILDEPQLGLDDGETILNMELSKVSGLAAGRELYSVVVCGGPKDDQPVPVGAITGVFEAQRLAKDLGSWQERATKAEQQRESWEKRAAVAEQQRESWEKRARVAEQQRESWEERAQEAERQVGETREQLNQAEHALGILVTSLSWRVTKPLRSARALVRPRR